MVLNRGTRYQQVINPYSADDHSEHPKIKYLLFEELSLYYFPLITC